MYIGIDGGGTKTACAVCNDDLTVRLATCTLGSCHIRQVGAAGIERVLSDALDFCAPYLTGTPASQVHVCIGLAGYGADTSTRVLLNIGGIANLTCIPCKGQLSDVFAFDCGPGNMMIDEACRELLGCEFDENGAFAQRGSLIEPLYRELLSHPYFKEPIPKSTGREQFGAPFVRELLARYSNEAPYNIVHTLAKVTVYGIADSYTRFVAPTLPSAPAELIVAGGGAHNTFLMHELACALPDVRVVTQDELGYSSDAKEAIAFAILGNETLHIKPSNVPAATGAASPQILGEITPAPYASAAALPTTDAAATFAALASTRTAASVQPAGLLD